MPQWNRLTAKKVAEATPGISKRDGKPIERRLVDGGGLILRVSKNHKAFAFRWERDGHEHVASIGPIRIITLAKARSVAAIMREQLQMGLDPLIERKRARAADRAEAAKLVPFREAAAQFFADREGDIADQYAKETDSSFARRVLPVIGDLAVPDVDTTAVLRVLERDRFWKSKPVTANRIRNWIEQILDWATVRDMRAGANPARWKGHLDHVLTAPGTIKPVVHRPSLPYEQLPAFMVVLRQCPAPAARALEFIILNASRLAEVIGAPPAEFNLEAKLWTIPKERMKGKPGKRREHVVPLTPRAIEMVRAQSCRRGLVFGVPKPTMGKFLASYMPGWVDEHGVPITIHGFRTTFSSWVAAETHFGVMEREVALAHVVGTQTQRAYQRDKLLGKRRPLMEAWADYCGRPPLAVARVA